MSKGNWVTSTEVYPTATSSVSFLETLAARKYILAVTYCGAQDHAKLHNSGFCENAQNCANDGGEFRLANGQFVNGKRTDKIFSFVSADSNSNVGTPFRKFMGSDGIERLWFNEGSTGTIVGHYVWDGMNEKVLITSETTKVGGMSTVHLLFDL